MFKDIGTVPGDVESESHAINDPGQVVGQSCDANGNCRAFFWENGAMTDLNALIPTSSPLYLGLFDASGINSRGTCNLTRFEHGKRIDAWLCRVSDYVPSLAPSRKAKPTT